MKKIVPVMSKVDVLEDILLGRKEHSYCLNVTNFVMKINIAIGVHLTKRGRFVTNLHHVELFKLQPADTVKHSVRTANIQTETFIIHCSASTK